MTDLDIQELANLTAGDADVDNFERLFTKLKEMKGKWRTNETDPVMLHVQPACFFSGFFIDKMFFLFSFNLKIKLLRCLMSREKSMQRR